MARRISPRHTLHRIRRAFAEMDHAQRRVFEIRTGLPSEHSVERARDKAMLAELEAHWRI
jgi:hypothetical protein